MNNIVFYCLIAIMIALAISYLTWILRSVKWLMRISILVFASISFSMYWHYGSGKQLIAYEQQKLKKAEIKKVLANYSGPLEVIERLKQRLAQDPNSSKGWYLLGRLYVSQNDYVNAVAAFEKANTLNPQDLTIQLNLAQALGLKGDDASVTKADHIVTKILNDNPNQEDALSLSAISAYRQKNYPKAIKQWQKLLLLVPANSNEEKVIKNAIKQARNDQQH
jgi:cytochrome c-type biogenesis protein CcmH